jgi:hypothetical protein
MARVFAHKSLLKRLASARAVYDTKNEREGLKLAVRECARYLDETDADPRLKMMFLSLGLALEEL